MGMPDVWQRVAEEIGFDAFLRMWMILDGEPAFQHAAAGEPIRITLRRFSSWLRFQRNRLIESLAAEGLTAHEIHGRLRAQLCESVSIGHIKRIARRA